MVRKPSVAVLDRVSRTHDTPIQAWVRDNFNVWLAGLRDGMARVLITDRIAAGNFGDHKSLRGGEHEVRVNRGPGHRLNFARHRQRVILLCADDRSSQGRDIRTAQPV